MNDSLKSIFATAEILSSCVRNRSEKINTISSQIEIPLSTDGFQETPSNSNDIASKVEVINAFFPVNSTGDQSLSSITEPSTVKSIDEGISNVLVFNVSDIKGYKDGQYVITRKNTDCSKINERKISRNGDEKIDSIISMPLPENNLSNVMADTVQLANLQDIPNIRNGLYILIRMTENKQENAEDSVKQGVKQNVCEKEGQGDHCINNFPEHCKVEVFDSSTEKEQSVGDIGNRPENSIEEEDTREENEVLPLNEVIPSALDHNFAMPMTSFQRTSRKSAKYRTFYKIFKTIHAPRGLSFAHLHLHMKDKNFKINSRSLHSLLYIGMEENDIEQCGPAGAKLYKCIKK